MDITDQPVNVTFVDVPAVKTEVTITSKKYSQNKISVMVDNDLNPSHTIYVPNTFFPYIIQFINNPTTNGKRYISEWLYRRLTDERVGDYNTDVGRVLSNLDKTAGIFPYYQLDWNVFVSLFLSEKKKTTETGGVELTKFGASLYTFNVNPIDLIYWLNIPTIDATQTPVTSFPNLVDYTFNLPTEIESESVPSQNENDFYDREYHINVKYTGDVEKNVLTNWVVEKSTNIQAHNPNAGRTDLYTNSEDGFPSNFLKIRVLANDTYQSIDDTNEISSNRIANIQRVSKTKTLDDVILNATNIKNNILGNSSDVSSISLEIKSKLDAIKLSTSSLPKLPQFPIIKLSQFVVVPKLRTATKKNIKRKPKLKNAYVNSSMPISSKIEVSAAASNLDLIAKNKNTTSNLKNLQSMVFVNTQQKLLSIKKKIGSTNG